MLYKKIRIIINYFENTKVLCISILLFIEQKPKRRAETAHLYGFHRSYRVSKFGPQPDSVTGFMLFKSFYIESSWFRH